MSYSLQKTSQTLKVGGLTTYPTEAVYGRGCIANDKKALKKLRSVKKRSRSKGFIVLCASIEQLVKHYPDLDLSPSQKELLQRQQAHPTTWIIPFKKRYKNKHEGLLGRSEERRVGKEDRTRWARYESVKQSESDQTDIAYEQPMSEL